MIKDIVHEVSVIGSIYKIHEVSVISLALFKLPELFSLFPL